MASSEQQPLIKRLHGSPATQRVLFVLALLYVLSPVDAIPDVAPLVGWMDDAGIILAEIVQFVFYLKNKRESVQTVINKASDGNTEVK